MKHFAIVPSDIVVAYFFIYLYSVFFRHVFLQPQPTLAWFVWNKQKREHAWYVRVIRVHIRIHVYIIPGNMYVEHMYIYACLRMCERITRTYQACSRFLFVSYKSSQGWLWFKKRMPEKNWIQTDEKIRHAEGTIAKCFIEARSEVHHNTTRAHTSLCPLQTKVLLRQQAAGRSSINL